jgi:hypothetical protein
MGEFRSLCAKEKMTELKWPERDYIIQVARFDPAKGQFHLCDPLQAFNFHVRRYSECYRLVS